MFQFPGFASVNGYLNFIQVGCPIRIPADQLVCADPRSFSQLVASFFASESLGIPRAPFSASAAGRQKATGPPLSHLGRITAA